MIQIQNPSTCNNFASFVYVVWNLNIKQSWQFGREAKLHSASGFSEQKYVKEEECDYFCSIILGKIISNVWDFQMIFPSLRIYLFLFIFCLLLWSKMYLVYFNEFTIFSNVFFVMYPNYLTLWWVSRKGVLLPLPTASSKTPWNSRSCSQIPAPKGNIYVTHTPTHTHIWYKNTFM